MVVMGHFHYNSLSKSLKYDLWKLWANSITIPYHNHWNMSYDSYGPFPLQFLIKIIEIWRMTARGNPYQNHRNMTYDYQGHFLYNFLSKASKHDLWMLGVISITFPHQNHWNIAYDCWGSFPSQFLIKIIEIWPMTARGHLLHRSV